MAKRQTRYLEVVVGAIPWRFKSSPAHSHKFAIVRTSARLPADVANNTIIKIEA